MSGNQISHTDASKGPVSVCGLAKSLAMLELSTSTYLLGHVKNCKPGFRPAQSSVMVKFTLTTI